MGSSTESGQQVTATERKKAFEVTEDWAAVALGFLLIFLFVGGLDIAAPAYAWKNGDELLNKVLSWSNLARIGWQFLAVLCAAVLGAWITGKAVRTMVVVLPLLLFVSAIALILEGSAAIRSLNLEAVIFSLAIGLLISNALALPQWFRDALNAEMFVKIGLVLLGTRVIFGDILRAGSLGLVQALVVVLAVWYFAFWLCRKLRLDEELSMMISSAVSICGVSAAIATAGAIKGDPRKLSYVISLVLVTAIPMMIVMPYAAKWMGLPDAVTGAWIGGTIDTTGAVVAAGTLVSDVALNTSTIVKFSQNVLLGVAAFAISIYWTYAGKGRKPARTQGPSLSVLWDRFPKFVLGFVAASLLFSFVLTGTVSTAARDGLKSLQTLWFVLAFTSIGLETRFADLFNRDNKRPLYAFLAAQAFNIAVTLLVALLLFGYAAEAL